MILGNDPEAMDEMTTGQEMRIIRLLDERRVHRATADAIIDLLIREPVLRATGLETLDQIQKPS